MEGVWQLFFFFFNVTHFCPIKAKHLRFFPPPFIWYVSYVAKLQLSRNLLTKWEYMRESTSTHHPEMFLFYELTGRHKCGSLLHCNFVLHIKNWKHVKCSIL